MTKYSEALLVNSAGRALLDISMRRTITGRVLRWAWHSEGGDCVLMSTRELHRRKLLCTIDTEQLIDLLGTPLCLRLARKHGDRYLEHALLVGTQRPKPGSKRWVEWQRSSTAASVCVAREPPR